MNFNEAMQMLGTKLQGKYGHLGFKYKKSDKTLTRHSKNFTYMIAFSSFGGNTKDSISIEVCYIINTRPYDPYGYAKPDINTQPLFYSLRDNEIYLDIGNEEKINNTFEIVCQWMDKILIPKMNELCAMGIASVQNPFTDRNMPYEQPFQPDAGDAEAVPIFVILSPIC